MTSQTSPSHLLFTKLFQHTLTSSLLLRPLYSVPLARDGVVSGCFSAPHFKPGPGAPLLTVIKSLPWQSNKHHTGTLCIHSAACISHSDFHTNPKYCSMNFVPVLMVLLEVTTNSTRLDKAFTLLYNQSPVH